MLSLSMRPLFRNISYFPGFPSNPWFFLWNTCFLRQDPVLPWFLHAVLRAVRDEGGREGSLGCLGGILGLLRLFSWVCSFTCQHDSWFRIPLRLPFTQGTGEPRSIDHPWIGPRNGDCDLYIYPPPYLQKGFSHFICHESTQLQEHVQCLPP